MISLRFLFRLNFPFKNASMKVNEFAFSQLSTSLFGRLKGGNSCLIQHRESLPLYLLSDQFKSLFKSKILIKSTKAKASSEGKLEINFPRFLGCLRKSFERKFLDKKFQPTRAFLSAKIFPSFVFQIANDDLIITFVLGKLLASF